MKGKKLEIQKNERYGEKEKKELRREEIRKRERKKKSESERDEMGQRNTEKTRRRGETE